jgi:hypothetical protein
VTLQTLFLALVWVCQGAATAAVVEYYTPELRHYFITASPAEQALVESGAMGLWTRTGGSFEAGGADPVCRFYGNTARNPATGASYGPNSHFYTVDAAECAGLQSAYRVDAPSWQFEGFGFQSTRSSGGLCAAPLCPVFRAYNQGYWRGIDSNHRLTADLGAYFETTAAGWAPEGVVMCAPPAPGSCSGAQLAWLEQAMNATLATVNTDADFSLLLESFDGRRYHYARGGATPARSYESASTSKWVSAAVILSLVDRGFLSLESRPQEFLEFWRLPADHPGQAITLRQLLAFTSGFSEEPLCLNLPNVDFAACVQSIYLANRDRRVVPGSEYHYASSHLQIAGLMALRARGLANWNELFAEFQARTGLFPTSRYDLPSARNPRLAGGMHWTGEEYLGFLRALRERRVLSDLMAAQLFSDQRGTARVAYSPALGSTGADWSYGLGNWLECASPVYNCGPGLHRNSSPGAYGAYPFIDFAQGYFGMLARQGGLGTGFEGVAVVRSIEAWAGKWARRSCP